MGLRSRVCNPTPGRVHPIFCVTVFNFTLQAQKVTTVTQIYRQRAKVVSVVENTEGTHTIILSNN